MEGSRRGVAEIISIGDELLIGQVVNTNASWMAEKLSLAGITLRQITAIGDREAEIHRAIDEALGRAQLVFITGGLGPTADDITKPALCRYFDTELVFNPAAYEQLKALFARRGWAVSERNKAQAMLPANCQPLANENGTAPGMWFERGDAIIVSMPGVPFEMKAMFENQVIPAIKEKIKTPVILHKTIMTAGAGESAIADIISHWENALPAHIKLAYLPQPGLVRLRLSGKGENEHRLATEIETLTNELVALIPGFVYGFDETTLEKAVGQLLLAKGYTLATAESCTGGTIAQLITSVPGSSAYFKGAVVAYANAVKTEMLGVDETLLQQYGAVSREVVMAMADGVRKALKTDFALATSGIAGPDGGTADKPVGTVWMALSAAGETIAVCHQLGEHRGRNISRASLLALNMLRIKLLQ